MSSDNSAAKAKTSQSKRKRSLSDTDDDLGLFGPPPTADSAEEGGNPRVKLEDSAEEGQDSAQDIARAIKKSKKPKPRPTKRQNKGPVPRSEKGKRKVGWRAAEDQAIFRSKEEKRQKLAKVATAFVKPIVKNNFGA